MVSLLLTQLATTFMVNPQLSGLWQGQETLPA